MQMQSRRGWGEKKHLLEGEKMDLLGMQIGPAPFYANKRRAKHFNVFLSCYSQTKSF